MFKLTFLATALACLLFIASAIAYSVPTNIAEVEGSWADPEHRCVPFITVQSSALTFFYASQLCQYRFDFVNNNHKFTCSGAPERAMTYKILTDNHREVLIAEKPEDPAPLEPGPGITVSHWHRCGTTELDLLGTLWTTNQDLRGVPTPVAPRVSSQQRRPQMQSTLVLYPRDMHILEFSLNTDDGTFAEVWNLQTSRGTRTKLGATQADPFVFSHNPDGTFTLAFRAQPDGIEPVIQPDIPGQRYETIYRDQSLPSGHRYSYRPDYFLGGADAWSCSNRAKGDDEGVLFTIPGTTTRCAQHIIDPIRSRGEETCTLADGTIERRLFTYYYNQDGTITFIMNKALEPVTRLPGDVGIYPSRFTHALSDHVYYQTVFPCSPSLAFAGAWFDASAPVSPLKERCAPFAPTGAVPTLRASQSLFYLSGNADPARVTFSEDDETGVVALSGATPSSPVTQTRFRYRFADRTRVVILRNTCPIGSTTCDDSTPVWPTNDPDALTYKSNPSSSSFHSAPRDLGEVQRLEYGRCDLRTLDPLLGRFHGETGSTITFTTPSSAAIREYTDEKGNGIRETVNLPQEIAEVTGDPTITTHRFALSPYSSLYITGHTSLDSREAALAGKPLRRFTHNDAMNRIVTGLYLHAELGMCTRHDLVSWLPYGAKYSTQRLDLKPSTPAQVAPSCVTTPLKTASAAVTVCTSSDRTETTRFMLFGRHRPIGMVLLRSTGENYVPGDITLNVAEAGVWIPCHFMTHDATFFSGSWRTGVNWKEPLGMEEFDDQMGAVMEEGLDRLGDELTYTQTIARETVEPPSDPDKPFVPPTTQEVTFDLPVEGLGLCSFYMNGLNDKGQLNCRSQGIEKPFFYKTTSDGLVLIRYSTESNDLPATASERAPGTGLIILSRGYALMSTYVSGGRHVTIRNMEAHRDDKANLRVLIRGPNSVTLGDYQGELISFFKNGRASYLLPSDEVPRPAIYVVNARGDVRLAFARRGLSELDTMDSLDGNVVQFQQISVPGSALPHIGLWTTDPNTPLEQCTSYNFGGPSDGVASVRVTNDGSGDIFVDSIVGIGSHFSPAPQKLSNSSDSTSVSVGDKNIYRLFRYSLVDENGFMSFTINNHDIKYMPELPVRASPAARSTLVTLIPCIEKAIVTTKVTYDAGEVFDDVAFAKLLNEDIADYIGVDSRFITARSKTVDTDRRIVTVNFAVTNNYARSMLIVLYSLERLHFMKKSSFRVLPDSTLITKTSTVPFPPPPSPEKSNKGMIAVAIVVPIVVIAIICYCIYVRRKAKRYSEPESSAINAGDQYGTYSTV